MPRLGSGRGPCITKLLGADVSVIVGAACQCDDADGVTYGYIAERDPALLRILAARPPLDTSYGSFHELSAFVHSADFRSLKLVRVALCASSLPVVTTSCGCDS